MRMAGYTFGISGRQQLSFRLHPSRMSQVCCVAWHFSQSGKSSLADRITSATTLFPFPRPLALDVYLAVQ